MMMQFGDEEDIMSHLPSKGEKDIVECDGVIVKLEAKKGVIQLVAAEKATVQFSMCVCEYHGPAVGDL
eukprot:91600-Hanusia_phi.AAC.1